MRLPGSLLAEVLREGERSDVSEGLQRPGFGGRLSGRPIPRFAPLSPRFLPCALPLALREERTRRPRWLLCRVAAVFSASASPSRLGVSRGLWQRSQEAKLWA